MSSSSAPGPASATTNDLDGNGAAPQPTQQLNNQQEHKSHNPNNDHKDPKPRRPYEYPVQHPATMFAPEIDLLAESYGGDPRDVHVSEVAHGAVRLHVKQLIVEAVASSHHEATITLESLLWVLERARSRFWYAQWRRLLVYVEQCARSGSSLTSESLKRNVTHFGGLPSGAQKQQSGQYAAPAPSPFVPRPFSSSIVGQLEDWHTARQQPTQSYGKALFSTAAQADDRKEVCAAVDRVVERFKDYSTLRTAAKKSVHIGWIQPMLMQVRVGLDGSAYQLLSFVCFDTLCIVLEAAVAVARTRERRNLLVRNRGRLERGLVPEVPAERVPLLGDDVREAVRLLHDERSRATIL